MPDTNKVVIEKDGKKFRIPNDKMRIRHYLEQGYEVSKDQALAAPPKAPETAGPAGEKKPTGPSLWEAANKPLGQDVAEQTRRWIADMSSRLPEKYRGPVAYGGTIAAAPFTAIAEAGRRMMTTPIGVGTAGAGGAMQALREMPQVPKAIKAATSLAELGTGTAFGAKGAEEALTKKEGESKLDEIERRLSGLGQAVGGLAPVAHAVGPSVKGALTGVPKMKVQVEDFLHTGGLAAQDHLQNAVDTAKKNVELTARDVSQTIDQRNTLGVIDADKIKKGIEDDLQQVVKLPETKKPTSLTNIQGHEGERQQIAAGGDIKPQGQKDLWTFEEAKQLRSELGYSLERLQGPMRAAANQAYQRLTTELRDAVANNTTPENNLMKKWEYYQKLHGNLKDRLKGKLGSMLDSETGLEVSRKLTDDPAFTRELVSDLKKYGLDVDAIAAYAKYANNAERHLSGGLTRHWPAAIFGGYLGRIFGIPWAEAAIAGGYGEPLMRLMKASKTARTSAFGGPGEKVIQKRSLPPKLERRTGEQGAPRTGERRTVPHQYTQADLADLIERTKPKGAQKTSAFDDVRKRVEEKREAE